MPLLTIILFYRLPKGITILSNLIKQNLIKHYGGLPMDNMIMTVPIHLKITLTIKEAAEYSNIGINKIDSLLRSPKCPFVLFVGTKKLVKRKEFEQFISDHIII
jgi:excisionase family DNA binding protein